MRTLNEVHAVPFLGSFVIGTLHLSVYFWDR